MSGRRVLVTNDDGISSPGLHALARVALDAGLDVVVAAPLEESSGSSAGLTAVEADGRVVVEERHLPGLDGVVAHGVAALPGFIALIATHGAFGPPPDLVLSGINRGPNTGHAILHSGTVGAALTANTAGCRAMAVSLDVGRRMHWGTAAGVAARVLPLLLDGDRPVVLNVNVPNLPVEELRGVRRAPLASFGAVQTTITEVGRGFVRVGVDEVDRAREPGSDASLVAEGYVTVTALQPVCEAHEPRLAALEEGRPTVGS